MSGWQGLWRIFRPDEPHAVVQAKPSAVSSTLCSFHLGAAATHPPTPTPTPPLPSLLVQTAYLRGSPFTLNLQMASLSRPSHSPSINNALINELVLGYMVVCVFGCASAYVCAVNCLCVCERLCSFLVIMEGKYN